MNFMLLAMHFESTELQKCAKNRFFSQIKYVYWKWLDKNPSGYPLILPDHLQLPSAVAMKIITFHIVIIFCHIRRIISFAVDFMQF